MKRERIALISYLFLMALLFMPSSVKSSSVIYGNSDGNAVIDSPIFMSSQSAPTPVSGGGFIYFDGTNFQVSENGASLEPLMGSADFNDGGDTASATRVLGNSSPHDMQFETNDSVYLHIEGDGAGSTEGFVGVGVTTPSSRLDVNGTATATTFSGSGASLTNIPVSGLANGTDGELVTWNSSGVATTITTGTSGQVLTSNGAGAEPTWQDATTSGSGWQDDGSTVRLETVSNTVAIGTTFAQQELRLYEESAAPTNSELLQLDVFNSTGAGTVGMGAGISFGGEAAEGIQEDMAFIDTEWNTVGTHGVMLMGVTDFGGENKTAISIIGNGTTYTSGHVNIGSETGFNVMPLEVVAQMDVGGSNNSVQDVLGMSILSTQSNGATGLGARFRTDIEDGSGNVSPATRMDSYWTDASNGSENAEFEFSVVNNGSMDDIVIIDETGVVPSNDSTYDLGASGNEWANVYADDITFTGNINGDGSNLTNLPSLFTDSGSFTYLSSTSDDFSIGANTSGGTRLEVTDDAGNAVNLSVAKLIRTNSTNGAENDAISLDFDISLFNLTTTDTVGRITVEQIESIQDEDSTDIIFSNMITGSLGEVFRLPAGGGAILQMGPAGSLELTSNGTTVNPLLELDTNNTTGDSAMRFFVGGPQFFTMGIDNSNSNAFVMNTSSALGASAADRFVMSTAGITSIGPTAGLPNVSEVRGLEISDSNLSETPLLRLENLNGGDAAIGFNLGSGNFWSIGVDDSDSDKFKIAGSDTSVSTNTRMTIDTSGNVGINETSPATRLHVGGSLTMEGTSEPSGVSGEGKIWFDSTAGAFRFKEGTGSATAFGGTADFNDGGDTASATRVLGNNSAHDMQFETNSTSYIHIEGDGTGSTEGYVGINTTAPDSELHVYDNDSLGALLTVESANAGSFADAAITFGVPGQSFAMGVDATDDSFKINDNGNLSGTATRIYIDSSGNVGIGSTDPTAKFEVECPSGFTAIKGGSTSNRFLGCMQNNHEGTGTWFVASDDCFDTYGGRLPTPEEWYIAALNFSAQLTNEDDGNDEWTATRTGGNFAIAVGDSAITTALELNAFLTSAAYRCWIDK